MTTQAARIYQIKKQHFYKARNERTESYFKFGIVSVGISNSAEHIHGFRGGSNIRVVETVEQPDVKAEDMLFLDYLGYGKVIAVESSILEPIQQQFTALKNADKITKITVQMAGGNV